MRSVRRVAVAFALVLPLAGCSHSDDDKTAAPTRGAKLYAARCAACHGVPPSAAVVGPTLKNERSGKDRDAVARAIEYPTPPMPKLFPAELTQRDVDDIATYVETL